jgi:hypothetical protein
MSPAFVVPVGMPNVPVQRAATGCSPPKPCLFHEFGGRGFPRLHLRLVRNIDPQVDAQVLIFSTDGQPVLLGHAVGFLRRNTFAFKSRVISPHTPY